MLRFVIVATVFLLCGTIGVSSAQSTFAAIANYLPSGSLSPYVIPTALQREMEEFDIPPKIAADQYVLAFHEPFISNQSFYVDLMTGVDIVAKAWAVKHGTEPSSMTYRVTVCLLSFALPGCQPKSKSNRDKMTVARQRLLIGAYGSVAKRDFLRSRLTEKFFQVPSIEKMDLQTTDINEYILINDLVR